MSRVIALFQTTRSAIKAERLCGRKSISCKVIPVPRKFSSECGMAIEFGKDQKEIVESIFLKEGIEVKFYEE